MYLELPVFKRCCFCLPLRYGLIAWGYIKLVLAAFLIVSLSLKILYENHRYPMNETMYTYRTVVVAILLTVISFDFVLTTVFIVGGHTKNLRLLTVYYYYSIGLWILTSLLSLSIISTYFNALFVNRTPWFHASTINILEWSSHVDSFVSQGYLLLLLRSEILKLKNNCEFRFVNNAAQSECIMDCKKDTPNESKTTHKEDGDKVASDV